MQGGALEAPKGQRAEARYSRVRVPGMGTLGGCASAFGQNPAPTEVNAGRKEPPRGERGSRTCGGC